MNLLFLTLSFICISMCENCTWWTKILLRWTLHFNQIDNIIWKVQATYIHYIMLQVVEMMRSQCKANKLFQYTLTHTHTHTILNKCRLLEKWIEFMFYIQYEHCSLIQWCFFCLSLTLALSFMRRVLRFRCLAEQCHQLVAQSTEQ